MAFVMIPEELLTVKLSSAQFRALIQIINNTYSSGKYAGCCCLGYQNLASLCFTTKAAIINTVKQLDELGFIEIDKREKFNRSNALRLTLENGFNRLRRKIGDFSGDTSKGYENNTDDRYEKDTDKGYEKDTQGYLKDTLGYENNTPHIDLKFKNLDLKNKTCACARKDGYLKDTDENMAPADVAAGRSKPKDKSARKAEARALPAKSKMPDLLRAVRSAFKDIFEDLSLSTLDNQFILRKKGRFSLVEDIRIQEVADWLILRGYAVKIMPIDYRFSGEILIEEVI